MSLTEPALSSSLLALATTVHFALASLRNHRSAGARAFSSLAVVGALLAATPWLFPTTIGIVLGLGLHAIWFVICDQLTSPPALAPVVAAARPAASSGGAMGVAPAAPVRANGTKRPAGFSTVPVIAVIDEAPDIRTFRFARPDGFDFVAGQFLTVRVRVDEKDHARCYSISSSPAERGYLEISVKRQGRISSVLHTTVRAGGSVTLRPPAGVFVYPVGDARPLLLVAGGIGITPLISMLRHAVSAEPARAVTLLYSAQREEDFAFRDELMVLARRHPQVNVVFAVTRGAGGPSVYPGRVDENLISTTVPNVADAITLICGPQGMIDAVRAILPGLGVPAPNIRSEVFEAAIAAVGDHRTDGVSKPRVATARGQGFSMRCARSNASIKVQAGQTVLEAAEAGGVAIDSLCRAGVCGTCRTRVIDGDVDCDTASLDQADRDEGIVLACVTQLRSDCTVDA